MNTSNLIKLKRNGGSLKKNQLEALISGYVNDSVPDYQMAAFLMAVYFNGMTDEEIFSLVEVMLDSGDRLDFSSQGRFVVDKHSTGGVGDKVSIILAPLMASLGLAVPMISGRSLGHTGGTLDKLETIPGFRVDLTTEEFRNQVDKYGLAMIGQTMDICPADKKMYALRDVTGTIESIPLICGSIMCKKIAEGLDGLVLDVKVGNGAFMKTLDDARELGSRLVRIGTEFGISTDAVYTNMNQPLGQVAGLWCEVRESIDILHGGGPPDTLDVTLALGEKLLIQSGISSSKEDARKAMTRHLESGQAYEIFLDMVRNQGGDPLKIARPDSLHRPEFEEIVAAENSGFIESLDTYGIGMSLLEMGGGRKKTSDSIDHTSGIEFLAKQGQKVNEGDPVYRCFNSDREKLQTGVDMLKDTFSVGAGKIADELILTV